MVHIDSSAADLRNSYAIEIHEIKFMPSKASSWDYHDPVVVEQIWHPENGYTNQLIVCADCCRPKIIISCGGQLDIESASLCKHFAPTPTVGLRNDRYNPLALLKWQNTINTVASITRSLMLDSFEQDFLKRTVIIGELIAWSQQPSESSFRPVRIKFPQKPQVTKLLNARVSVFANVLRPDLFHYRHSEGCLYSSNPEFNIQDPVGSSKMSKTLFLRLCNKGYVNIEGYLLGITAKKDLDSQMFSVAYNVPAYDTKDLLQLRSLINLSIADEDGIICRGFLATASAETLALRERIMDQNGKSFWLNIIHP